MSLSLTKSSTGVMDKFISGLKSRHEEKRIATAYELQRYVTTELREVSTVELVKFLEDFNEPIYQMSISDDINDKKGAIYAIMSLLDVDVGATGQRISRFANYLQKLFECQDSVVLELTAKAVGRLFLSSGTYTTYFVDSLFKKAFEWLQEDRNEHRRHAAVLVLKELAQSIPTYFFQQVQQFFDVIFEAVVDPKPSVREGAVAAIRVAFTITAQRETKESQQPLWYKQCFNEILSNLEESEIRDKNISRDDKIHGSLLVLNELLRTGNNDWEKTNRELQHLTHYQSCLVASQKGPVSRKNRGQSGMRGPKSFQSLFSIPTQSWFEEEEYTELHCGSLNCRNLILEKYDKICSVVMAQKMSKNPHVQTGLLNVIPRLAAINKEYFCRCYLQQCLNFLLNNVKPREKDKSGSFVCLGLLSVAVGTSISKYLGPIINAFKSSLPNKDTPSRKKIVDPFVCICISLVAKAVGSSITPEIQQLLDPMMAGGLSAPLTVALKSLSSDLPKLKRHITKGILSILSQTLCNRTMSDSVHSTPSPSPEHHSTDSIVLALKTLGSFDFENSEQSLMPFITHISDKYLTSDHKIIRLESIPTILHLLRPMFLSMEPFDLTEQPNPIYDIVAKVLWVSASDIDPDVRLAALVSFDDAFDFHLSQADTVNALTYAMSDEKFEIREHAIAILGRLSDCNASYVYPLLRKATLKFLGELEYSGIGRNREQSARMLGILISSAPNFMRHFIAPLMSKLVPKLKDLDPNPAVTMYILTAIGDLAEGSGAELEKWLDDVLPILIHILSDGTSGWKRQIALVTFGQLVENTGYAVHPYTKYPNLLDILLNFLKTEQKPTVRRETLRLLGFLGALDPYKHKMNTGMIKIQQDTGVALICMTESKEEDMSDLSDSEMLVNLNYSSLEEFYPACAIAVLLRMVKDPALKQHNNEIVHALTFIYKSLGEKGVPFLPRVIPAIIYVIRNSGSNFHNFLFKELATIIDIVKLHIRNHLGDIIEVLTDFWTSNQYENIITIITVVETIATAVGSELKVYLKPLVPMILKTFMNDQKERTVSKRLMEALQKFGPTIEEFIHVILPPIVRLFNLPGTSIDIRRTAIFTVDHFINYLDLTDYVSQIIHPLLRTIETTPELRSQSMELLCSLATQLSRSFESFVPGVQRILNKHKITDQRYDVLVAKVVKGLPVTEDEMHLMGNPKNKYDIQLEPVVPIKKQENMGLDSLQRMWSFSRLVSKDDWLEWLRRLSIGLMKCSPNPAIKSCAVLAGTYVQLSRDLFNVAFVSVWSELNESMQDDLLSSLKQALDSQEIPEITQTLLNLAEFMEHCDKGVLPLELELVGRKAIECRAYAKALHYKEEQFYKEPTIQVLESLISINNKLGQTEAAAGLLEYCRKNNREEMKMQERWFEKLHDWDKALEAYRHKLNIEPHNRDHALGQMRCLEALGEWGELYSLADQQFNQDTDINESCRIQMSRVSAAASWATGHWDSMKVYVGYIPRETQEGAYYRAVLAIAQSDYRQAQELIELSRDLLDNELTAMVGESYQRAYTAMVSVQMLAELEEVIQYRLQPTKRKTIQQIWWNRFLGCQRVVEDWHKILLVRDLVLSPSEGMGGWLKFASLCRKSGRLNLAQKTLVNLFGRDPSRDPEVTLSYKPKLSYKYCKFLWGCPGQKEKAYGMIKTFVAQLQTVVRGLNNGEYLALLSRSYLKLGLWHQELNGFNEASLDTVIQYLKAAREKDDTCYKAWHAYACTLFEGLTIIKAKVDSMKTDPLLKLHQNSVSDDEEEDPSEMIVEFATYACMGFARSISLSRNNNNLQDTLRFLTVCFEYGSIPIVHQTVTERFKTIPVDNWLQVIPQLIARIDNPHALVNKLIQNLLITVGKQHPQALLYPLTVAVKASESSRTKAADVVLKSMREHSNELVNQAMMISEELIRVAILWHEKWHEALEEASKFYFGENNIPAMLRVLRPLHAMMEKGPTTLKEFSFNQAYSRDLVEAAEWCAEYQRSGVIRDLTQAWDLYYQVFRRISRQLTLLSSLDLEMVSPRLYECKDLDIAVPGSYSPNSPINRISSIQSNIQVLSSKQKPRKLCIRGSDGHDYVFLLKGHEDLRQDERVMQLFGLVNTLLVSNSETFRRNLTIQRYAVIPLSTNSGLIGWVPNCDTLHVLIRDWREKKKILLIIEHRIMTRMAAELDHLTLMQKVEVFEHALDMTKGDDLCKLLWFKSPSSEVWFDRRTNYIRSLAVMSMVGYVLGLGDRHPSNLMLHQSSGKIVHIDFGDCFEVAMAREKFPEKIPFRLTRMLINAMEVTGIEGTYRATCDSVMALLRKNKDSLMAMLEAFIYDPLLNWRLIEKGPKNTQDSDPNEVISKLVASRTQVTESSDPDGPDPNDDVQKVAEAANKKAVGVVNRVRDKLTGRDFRQSEALDVHKQVDLLIEQAVSHENLCQCYIGWCPFW